MAVDTILPMKLAFVDGGQTGSPPYLDLPEAATQTFKTGAVLVMSAGYVAEGGANPTSIVGVSEQNGANSASAGGQTDRVIQALPNCVFEANLDATAAGDPSGAYALTQADLGKAYGIAKGTTSGLWYINQSDTTNKRVVIVGFRDAVGTTAARVYFKFLHTDGDTIFG